MFPSKVNILVCDDSKVARSMLINILQEFHFTNIHETSSGEQALKIINDPDAKDFSLIFMDINMPGISGVDVVKRAKSLSRYKDVPIIMVSAEAEKEIVMDALVSGAIDYVIKPIDTQTLMIKIQEAWKRTPEEFKSKIILKAAM